MNIEDLFMEGFTVHDSTRLKLPKNGIVTIAGPNGSGKSSMEDAVAWCLWNKTLRGTPPWTEGKTCLAQLYLPDHDLRVQRTRKATKTSLSFWKEGGKPVEFETSTKAQEALEATIGSFDIWRRSHAFSSHDAAHFTLATDAERKRLIEGILGVERFDVGLDSCRVDLRDVGTRAAALQRTIEQDAIRVENERRRIREAKQQLAASQPPDLQPSGPKPDMKKLDGQLTAAASDISEARGKMRELDTAGGEHIATARQMEAAIERLRGSACPTCAQPIPDALRETLREAAASAREKVAKARTKAEAKKSELQELLLELEEEKALLAEKRHNLSTAEKIRNMREQEHLRWENQRKAAEAQLTSAGEELDGLLARSQKQMVELDALRHEAKELELVEIVLGLRGVRAHILGKSLGGIEAVANAWLARLRREPLTVRLRPFSEKRTGGVTDAISLEVNGAGGGYGYKASSGGERRRVDFAMLLALAEVASAGRGARAGTLFLDEVIDAVDADGIPAVVDAITELARDRAVVVITHREDFIDNLPKGSLHYFIKEGTVRLI